MMMMTFCSLELHYELLNHSLSSRDASGQEKYIHLCENFFRAANGAVFVYDVNKRQSFQNLKKWIRKVKEHAKGKGDGMAYNSPRWQDSPSIKWDNLNVEILSICPCY